MIPNSIRNSKLVSCQTIIVWYDIILFTHQYQMIQHKINTIWHDLRIILIVRFWCCPLFRLSQQPLISSDKLFHTVICLNLRILSLLVKIKVILKETIDVAAPAGMACLLLRVRYVWEKEKQVTHAREKISLIF